jgi:predicted GIY-YIG superfamily endonuclease
MTWWVYLVRCGDGTLYCGIALDVEARLGQHRAGKGAKYTRGRGPLELVYREACGTRAAALLRERTIKALSRARKLALIRSET